jgi:hypothetical protein
MTTWYGTGADQSPSNVVSKACTRSRTFVIVPGGKIAAGDGFCFPRDGDEDWRGQQSVHAG